MKPADGMVIQEQLPERALMIVAAAALVDGDGRILIQQRPAGRPMAGLWEFPGGKVEQGESPEAALIRELQEELGVSTRTACLAPCGFGTAPVGSRHVVLLLYICRKWKGLPQAHAATALKWVYPRELHDFPMPEADKPLIALLDALL